MKTRSAYKKESEQPRPDVSSATRKLKFDDPKTPNQGRVNRSSRKKVSTEPRPSTSAESRALRLDAPKTARQAKKTRSSFKKKNSEGTSPIASPKRTLQFKGPRTPYRKAKANNPYGSVKRQTPQRTKSIKTPVQKVKQPGPTNSLKKPSRSANFASTPHPKSGYLLAPDGSFIKKTPRKQESPLKADNSVPMDPKTQRPVPVKAPRTEALKLRATSSPNTRNDEPHKKDSLVTKSPRRPKNKETTISEKKTEEKMFSMAPPAKTSDRTKLSQISSFETVKSLGLGPFCPSMNSTPSREQVSAATLRLDTTAMAGATTAVGKKSKVDATVAEAPRQDAKTSLLPPSETTIPALTCSPFICLVKANQSHAAAISKTTSGRVVETKDRKYDKTPVSGTKGITTGTCKKVAADGSPKTVKFLSLTPCQLVGLQSNEEAAVKPTKTTTPCVRAKKHPAPTPVPPVPAPKTQIASILRKAKTVNDLDITLHGPTTAKLVNDTKKADATPLEEPEIFDSDKTGLSLGKGYPKSPIIKVVPDITKVTSQFASPRPSSIRQQNAPSPAVSMISPASSEDEFFAPAVLSPPIFSSSFSKSKRYTATGTPVKALEDLIEETLEDRNGVYPTTPKAKTTTKEFKKAAVLSKRSPHILFSSSKSHRAQAISLASPIDGGSLGSFSHKGNENESGGDTPLQMFIAFHENAPPPQSLSQRLADTKFQDAKDVQTIGEKREDCFGESGIDDIPEMTIEQIDAELGDLFLENNSFSF